MGADWCRSHPVDWVGLAFDGSAARGRLPAEDCRGDGAVGMANIEIDAADSH